MLKKDIYITKNFKKKIYKPRKNYAIIKGKKEGLV